MTVSTLEHERKGLVMDGSGTIDQLDSESQSTGFSAVPAPYRQVDPLSVTKRLQRDGRWPEVEPVRNRLIKECRQKGMNKPEAQAWTYSELDRLYPPLATEQTPIVDSELGSIDRAPVSGLSDLPASWGMLPGNASLSAEIGWVQANRLWVVEEKTDGSTVVHLDRAKSPAPSWSALSWLEASIRVHSKFVDVAAKASANLHDEQEYVRRELVQIDNLRSMLAEMTKDSDEG
jgi:hypothetical protein